MKKNFALGLALVGIGVMGWWILGNQPATPDGAGVVGLTPVATVEPFFEPEPASGFPVAAAPAVLVDIPPPTVSEELVPQSGPTMLTVGQGVFGRVTRPGGEPVVGRTVVVSTLRNGKRSSRATGKTNASGAYAVPYAMRTRELGLGQAEDFDVQEFREWVQKNIEAGVGEAELGKKAAEVFFEPQRSSDEPAWLEVAVQDAQGFRAVEQITLRENMPKSVRVDLVIERRRDIEGEVLGATSRVPGVDVSLFDVGWNLVGQTRTDDEGKFRMKGPPPGSFRLHARMIGVGAGQNGGVFVGGAIRAPYQVIQLNGGMTLRGVVVTPTGEKVVGLRLVGVADVLAQAAQDLAWPTVRELAQAEAPGALCYSKTMTGPKGGFSMDAMEQGFYHLRFDDAPGKFQPKGLWRTGKDNRVVFSACQLTVILDGGLGGLRSVKIHCVEKRNTLRPKDRKMRHFTQNGEYRGARFVLEPGSHWEVFVSKGGKRQPPESLFLDTGNYLSTVTLVVKPWKKIAARETPELPPAEGLSTLEIELRDKQGKKYPGLARLWRLEPSGRKLVVDRQRIPQGGFEGLEPGEYHVAVESIAGVASFLPSSAKKVVALVPGRSAKLQLTVEAGGWLWLNLSGPDEYAAERFTASLVPAGKGAQSIALSFDMEGEGEIVPVLSLGQSARCAPVLRPGIYELQVRSTIENHVIPARSIEIEGGKGLLVSVDVPN